MRPEIGPPIALKGFETTYACSKFHVRSAQLTGSSNSPMPSLDLKSTPLVLILKVCIQALQWPTPNQTNIARYIAPCEKTAVCTVLLWAPHMFPGGWQRRGTNSLDYTIVVNNANFVRETFPHHLVKSNKVLKRKFHFNPNPKP